MASEFITRVERGEDEPYTVIFRTDDADKYKHIEDECRRMICHEKPTVDAVQVVRCKDCVKRPPATARNGDEPTSDCPLWCGYCFGINDNYGGEFFCGVGARE